MFTRRNGLSSVQDTQIELYITYIQYKWKRKKKGK